MSLSWWGTLYQSIRRRPLRHLVNLEMFLFGMWLAMPFDTFSSTPTLRVMSEWAPEWAWTLIFLAVSLFQLFAFTSNQSRWIIVGSAHAAVLWLIVSVSFWYGNPVSTASVTYPIFVLANLVIMSQPLESSA